MTDEQLVATIGAGNLVRLDQKANRFGGIHGDTSLIFNDLQVLGFEIGNTRFSAILLMHVYALGAPKLSEVILRNSLEFDEKLRLSEVNLIRKILVENYGSPIRQGSSDRVFWRFHTTSITLATVFQTC